MNHLQKALLANALFSGLSGIILIALNKQISKLFEISNQSIFWIIGITLIFFSLTIVFEMKKQKPLRVKIIIIQDFLWVIASIILLIIQPFEISVSGNIIIAVVAMVVLFMAINQSRALAKINITSKTTL